MPTQGAPMTITDQIREVLHYAKGRALTMREIMERLPPGTSIDTVGALLAQRRKAQEFICESAGTLLAYKLNPHRPPVPIGGKPQIAPPRDQPEPPKIDRGAEDSAAGAVARLVKPANPAPVATQIAPARPEPKPAPPRIDTMELDRRIKRARGMLGEMAAAAQSTLDAMIDALPNADAFRKALLARDQGLEFMATWGAENGRRT